MKRIILLAAACVIAATPALAGYGEKGEWEFGPYLGYGFLDEYSPLNPDDDILYGARVGYFFTPKWSLEASYQTLSTETDPDSGSGLSEDDLDIDSLRLNLLWNFNPGKALRWHLTAGVGSEKTSLGSDLDESDIGYIAGGGLRWFFTDHFGLRADGRYVMTDIGGDLDEKQNNIEAAVGLLWTFGGGAPPDSDGDGVPDRKDDCPDTPKGATVDMKGCPSDTDGDGVLDGLDSCPQTAKGYPVNAKGCDLDTDGDGVPDGGDSCPATPKGAKVDAKGCPMDSDGDGVFDGLDACASTPKGVKVDAKGCPVDSDGDGVFDGLDRCADTPRGVKIDASGCPIPEPPKPVAPAIFEGKKTLVLEGVTFETNSAKLTPQAEEVLARVAGSLHDWPELRLEVGGHSDSTGSDSYNLSLSQKRADSVMQYLVGKGVPAANLTARGYGESSPVGDNETSEGRGLNRRVELTQLD